MYDMYYFEKGAYVNVWYTISVYELGNLMKPNTTHIYFTKA